MSHTNLLSLSTLLLVSGIGAAFVGKRSKPQAIALATLVLLFFLLASCFLAANQFTGRGIDQAVLYHATYGLEGAGFGDYSLLILGIALLVLVGVGLACGLAWLLIRSTAPIRPLPTQRLALPLTLAACLVNPATKDLLSLFGPKALANFGTRTAASSTFAKHYRVPELGPDPKVRPNLVFIYAEGLEHTYFDESRFPGLVVQMREVEGLATSFTNIEQTEGTTFTIGGMVGSQCGFPLMTSSGANSMSGMGKFLPDAVCLGDLLSARGYHMAFVGGATLRFAGKGKFLRTHGFHDVQGREQLQPLVGDTKYRSAWGLYDDSLLDIAYDKFVALSSRAENFGLFLLTLDTHAPDGHLSKRVADVRYGDGTVSMLNAVAGADRLLGAFVRRIMASPHGKDTVIVVASDHLAMKNGASDKLNSGTRKNLFLVIDPKNPKPARVHTPGTTLDIGPTVLHALGYQGQLGLGRNLLGDEPTLRQQLPDLRAAIGGWRRDLAGFWGMNELTSVKVRPDQRTLEAGGTTLRIPVLITFDESWNADVFFEFDNTKELSDYVAELAPGTPFTWVGQCDKVNGYVAEAGQQAPAGNCILAARRGARPAFLESVDRDTELARSDLRRVLESAVEPGLYEQQARGILETLLPSGLGELFRNMPDGAEFFHSKRRTAQRIDRYAKLAQLGARNIRITQSMPKTREFYFAATDLKRVKGTGRYDVSRMSFGEDLLALLRRHEQDTVIVAAKDDARGRLSAGTLRYFEKLGVDLGTLKFRGSFAAVLDGGRPLAAEVNNEDAVLLMSPALEKRGINRVESAGYGAGNYSTIIVDGRDLSKNGRGLNLVVLTRGGQRLSMNVDTAVSENLCLDMFKATPRREPLSR